MLAVDGRRDDDADAQNSASHNDGECHVLIFSELFSKVTRCEQIHDEEGDECDDETDGAVNERFQYSDPEDIEIHMKYLIVYMFIYHYPFRRPLYCVS